MERRQPLSLTSEEMRAFGYRVVDLLVDHFTALPTKSVTCKTDRATMETLLREPLPDFGADPMAVLEQVSRDVLAQITHVDHPRFFAFVPGPGNFVGAMADALAAGFNVFAGTWLEGPGAAQVELVAVDWLREACGFRASAGGLFVSGGSAANLTALAVARQVRLEGVMKESVVYYSDQTHSSVDRGLRVLGFGPDQIRRLPSDTAFRLDAAVLQQVVAADRAAGRTPFCVVANAGTTNTGTVDPLPVLAELCRAEGLWLHVDGAYGAAAALCDRGRAQLVGLGAADSLAIDPHKWLFQPFEIGCVLVRQESWLRETFHVLPEYLADVEERTGQVNFGDRGIQLTRSFRALKLWLSLKIFGAEAFRAAIERGFVLAELAQEAVQALSGWEVVTPAQMAIVTFRCAPPDLSEEARDRLNRQLVEVMMADGYAWVTSTVLRGRTVLRMCTINPRTTEADVEETVQRLDLHVRRLR